MIIAKLPIQLARQAPNRFNKLHAVHFAIAYHAQVCMLQGATYLWHAFVFHILFNETCKTATKYISMNLQRNLHNEKSDGKLLPKCQWRTSGSHRQTQKEVFWTGYVLRLGFNPTPPQVKQVLQNEALLPLLSFSLSCHMHSTNA